VEETAYNRRRWFGRRGKRVIWITLIVVVVVAALVYFVVRPREPRVTVTSVQKTTIANTVFAAGDVHPTDRQVIQPASVTSPISKVYVKVGQHVHQGELLLTLDNTAQSAQLSAAKIQVNEAQASLNQTEAQANATPAAFQAQFTGTLSSLQSSLAQAKAQLASAQAAYDQTLIKSTLNGTVLTLNPDGIAPNGSAAPIIEVVGEDKQVVLNVSEVDAVHLKAGQKATVQSDAYPNKTWNATISSVALFASSASSGGAGQVEVDLSLPTNCPIPFGYQVNVHITSETHKNALTLPYSALSQAGSQYVVYVVKGNRALETPVQLGITTNTSVEVTSGLKQGQVVIDSPPVNLQSGARVVVIGHD
jgi:RND family efflux transporter MFP subunit